MPSELVTLRPARPLQTDPAGLTDRRAASALRRAI